MADMMKRMGKKGMLKQMMGSMFGKGGMPGAGGQPDMAALEAAAQAQAAKMPKGMGAMGGFPGAGGQLPPGLSGFGKKK
jgi:signal recognition particle subunit SRP54